MKHYISIKDIDYWTELRLAIFEDIAEGKHYKALYTLQRAHNCSIKTASKKLLESTEFAEKCVEHVNEPEVYKKMMPELITNYHKFEDLELDLPTREADIMIEKGGMTIYFFIDERLELCYENNEYTLGRLLVDEFSNTLLYNCLTDDGWSEYKDKKDDGVETRVAIAYKEFLAERELLGDD